MGDYDTYGTCGTCLLCIRTNLGCECSLTDNDIEETQEACVDYIPEEGGGRE